MTKIKIVRIIIGLSWGVWACSSHQTNTQQEEKPLSQMPLSYSPAMDNWSGEQLAQVYCGSCHQFPEPSLLAKAVWENDVLPNMAFRLGLKNKGRDLYKEISMYDAFFVKEAGIFAEAPLLTEEAWEKIVSYYLQEAPDTLPAQSARPVISPALDYFSVQKPSFDTRRAPYTTLVAFHPATSSIYVGDARNNLYVLDANSTELITTYPADSPPSSIHFTDEGSFHLLTMGHMHPADEPLGKFLTPVSQDTLRSVLENLPRPVHTTVGDLNQDGREDVVVCGFGNYLGKFSWFEQLENQQYKEHILEKAPGARMAYIHDLNTDGLPDILVLMAQGDERIVAWTNQGDGHFTRKTLLRFPPVYGSSYFEIVDFNKDGAWDILYTNGDNADFSYSQKPYHGVRIFLNNGDRAADRRRPGNQEFEEIWFYPMYGASMAKARDFDRDGDLDIAAIAFFPDYEHQPEEGFLYFENQGNWEFNVTTFPNAAEGRWITFDTGDIDNDGDADIILGSFIFSPPVPAELQQKWINEGSDILILRNETIHSEPAF